MCSFRYKLRLDSSHRYQSPFSVSRPLSYVLFPHLYKHRGLRNAVIVFISTDLTICDLVCFRQPQLQVFIVFATQRIGLLPDLVVFLFLCKKIRQPNTTIKFRLKHDIIDLCFVNELSKRLYVFRTLTTCKFRSTLRKIQLKLGMISWGLGSVPGVAYFGRHVHPDSTRT